MKRSVENIRNFAKINFIYFWWNDKLEFKRNITELSVFLPSKFLHGATERKNSLGTHFLPDIPPLSHCGCIAQASQDFHCVADDD